MLTLQNTGSDQLRLSQINLNGELTADVAAGGVISMSNTVDDGSGTFGLTKDGAGTLFLGSANTYDGDTTLNAGTMVLNNDGALGNGTLIVNGASEIDPGPSTAFGPPNRTLANNITLNAQLTVNAAGGDTFTLDGVISGTDSLIKVGAGTLTLTAQNTFDTLTVSSGTVTLNEAGGNAIADSSDMVVAAGGTLDLQTNETIAALSGGGGTAQLNANDLTVGDASDFSFGGDMAGSGTFTKQGTGAMTLTGDSSGFTGPTALSAGALVVNGQLGGAVTVNAGSTLMGTGTLNGSVTNNGTVAPGNSIGTLSVGGDFDLASGSTLNIELDGSLPIVPGTSHDLLDATGDVSLANGSTVNAQTSNEEDITDGDSFTIIQANGSSGISEDGASITTTSSLWEFVFDPTFVDGDNAIALIAESLATLSDRAGGGNVGAIALALDNATPTPGSDFETLINDLTALTDAQLAEALDQISPQPHGSTVVSTVQATSTFNASFSQTLRGSRDGLATAAYDLTPARPGGGPMLASMAADPALLAYAMQKTEAEADAQSADNGEAPSEFTRPSRTNQTNEQHYAVFARPYGVFQQQDGTDNFRGFDGDTYGFVTGGQVLVGEAINVGLVFGYDRTELDFDNGTGSLDSDSLRIGPYLTYEHADWFVNAAATWGYHDFESERVMGAPVNATADADYEGYDLSLFADIGLDIRRDSWIITPMGSLQYTYLNTDGFTESGAGAANMSVGDQEHDSLRSRLGVNIAYQWQLGEIPVVPEAFIGWEHEFLADDADLTARFAGGGGAFTLDTGSPNEDAVIFGAGVSALVKQNLSVFFRYDGTVYNDLDVHAVNGGVTFRF